MPEIGSNLTALTASSSSSTSTPSNLASCPISVKSKYSTELSILIHTLFKTTPKSSKSRSEELRATAEADRMRQGVTILFSLMVPETAILTSSATHTSSGPVWTTVRRRRLPYRHPAEEWSSWCTRSSSLTFRLSEKSETNSSRAKLSTSILRAINGTAKLTSKA